MWIDDLVLARSREHLAIAVWTPRRPLVVLGSGNKPEVECHSAHCAADNVPILKRYGGGGSVVLHPGCVVATVGCWVSHPYRNDHYFAALNQSLIAALAQRWPALAELQQRGISDLAWGDYKVAGTSLFRSRNYLLYQASLLVDAQVDLMERYLPHPSREPGYRQQKSHRQFVSDLAHCSPGINCTAVGDCLRQQWPRSLRQHLGDDLIDSQPQQVGHLLARAERSGSLTEAQAWAEAYVKPEARRPIPAAMLDC